LARTTLDASNAAFDRMLEEERDATALGLAEVAETAARTFAPQFDDAGITFAADTEPAWVAGDNRRLEEVTANLLSNALRYTEPGGRVDVTVRAADGDAVLEVADTGIGIAPEDLQHIYTRFWRGDRSRSRTTGGSGIGLAIVHELVRAHDGRIDVDSAPGRGSRFRVILPRVRPPAS
jgi:signal transduction histidine kinase